MSGEKQKVDWVGLYKGASPSTCSICGGPILPESYVGIKPDGAIYCKKCVTDEVIKLQAKELEKNGEHFYI